MSVEWLGPKKVTLARHADAAAPPADAVQARVHYRLDGKTKRPTFAAVTAADLTELRAFVATLLVAYHHDWPADTAGKPIAPTALPAATSALSDPVAQTPATAPPRVSLADLGAGAALCPLDAPRLVEMFRNHQRVGKKRSGGGKKQRNTHTNYRTQLNFFLEHARYEPGDPRLAVLGLAAGASWVFDNEQAPITEADLLHLIAIRTTTNLRVRAVNERRLAKWENDVAAAVRRGDTEAAAAIAMPDLTPEECAARTVEAFAQQLGALLTHAYKRKWIAYDLWTDDVKDEVPQAASTSYTRRVVADRSQVGELVSTMRKYTRSWRARNNEVRIVDGDRYAAAVWVAGRMGTRPEELIAIRDSWVILEPADPRIVLRHAEIVQPAFDDQPRRRERVSLKHRAEGEVRVLRPDEHDRAEFIEVLGRHRRDHVDSATGADAYFFTTHNGVPLELSNFNDNWWKPVRDLVFANERYLADMPFRRLRAAAVTDWLFVLGWNTGVAAEMAGHSQAILEKHYKGVISERPRDNTGHQRAVPSPPVVPVDPSTLTAAQIAERKAELLSELERSREEFLRLQAVETERLDKLI